MKLEHLRKDYELFQNSKEMHADPFIQFKGWFEEALAAQIQESNACALATVSLEGKPSCRMVLCKGFDASGLIFFTNYNSRKAQELAANPCASLVFFWKEIHKQVLIEGSVIKLPKIVSKAYFASRPRGSQLGAWCSTHQSKRLSSRNILENRYVKLNEKFAGKEIPCPRFWGGYKLIPSRFEFWQGRKDRLHDRFCYQLSEDLWKIFRLYP